MSAIFRNIKSDKGSIMIKSGLCSVTFRSLQVEDVLKICREAKLQGIEWGGDIHVPSGDIHRARRVAELSKQAGIEVASYGSYFRTGGSEDEGLYFHTVLDTAAAFSMSCRAVSG